MARSKVAVKPVARRGRGPDPRTAAALALAGLYALLVAGLWGAATTYYRGYKKEFVRKVRDQVLAVAESKAADVGRFRRRCVENVESVANNAAFAALTRRFAAAPSDAEARGLLRGWLENVRRYGGYDAVRLVDARGRVLLAAPDGPSPSPEALREYAAEALRGRRPVLTDLRRDAPDGPVRVWALAPVFDSENAGRPLGVVELSVDAAKHVDNSLRRWPVPSHSGETVLLRRDRDAMLVLNEPRFRAGSALSLRLPLTPHADPAELAASLDYRGVPAVAALMPVSGSPWYVVSRVDAAEAYEPLTRSVDLLAGFAVLLLFGVGMAFALIWRRQNDSFDAALADGERFNRDIVDQAGEGISAYDRDLRCLTWNRFLEETVGVAAEEARGRPAAELLPNLRRPGAEALARRALAGEIVDLPEADFRAPSGRESWLTGTLAPRRDAQGRIVGVIAVVADILTRKRAEDSLRLAEARYRVLFKQSPHGVVLVDFETGETLEANVAAYAQLGYGREEFSRVNFMELEADPDPAELRRRLDAIARSGGVEFEAVFRARDGGRRDMQVSIKTLSINGQTLYFALMRDITGPKQAERALAQSEALFRTLAELSTVGICRADASGRIVYVNDCCREILGLGRDAPPISGWGTLMHPDDRERVGAAWKSAVRRVDKFAEEFRFVRPDASAAWVVVQSRPERGPQGEVYGHVGTVIDITERKQAERVVLERNKRYSDLVENLEEMVIVVAADGRLEFVNAAWKKTLGWGDDAAAGLDFWSTVHPEHAAAGREFFAGLERGGRAAVARTVFVDRAGRSLPVEIHAGPVFENGRLARWRCIARDVGARERIEAERARADFFQSLGVFAGGVAHDFNNLLTGILGNLSLARGPGHSPQDVAEILREAEAGAVRAKDLARQLLTFAKGGEPIKRTVSLAGVLRDAAGLVVRGSSVKLSFDAPSDLWLVSADPAQVTQVVSNIVINAKQSMPNGGTVALRAENAELTDADVRLRPALKAGRYVRIEVEDSGCGIPEANVARIFDPYFTTKKEGSGLGLAVCHSIVVRHGGAVEVSSAVGKGSVFTLFLPATDVPAPAEKAPPPPAALPRGSGRVLLMDDEPSIRRVAARILVGAGYEVEQSQDGQEAVAKFRAAQDEGRAFAAVILDMTVPGGMGGREALALLRQAEPALKAIVSTGYSEQPIADYLQQGFAAYLPKPYSAAELTRTVHELLTS